MPYITVGKENSKDISTTKIVFPMKHFREAYEKLARGKNVLQMAEV
jgi:hypothetical protein